MKATAKNRRISRIKESYLDIVREWPLATIKNDSSYDAAALVLNRLAVRDDLDDGEEQYLEVLEMLIEAYDDKHAPIMPDGRSPLERLTALMESSGTTAAGLRSILGASQPTVSLILGGHRELSKKTILKLARHFKLEPGYFM